MNRVVVPSIIDIEASGFGTESYPIEVGVALASGQRLSMLIKPHSAWTHWDSEAESLHKISRETLGSKGVELHKVAQIFNDLLMNQTVYSDAWVVDKPWINRLYEQAQIPMRFSVSPIEQIMKEEQFDSWDGIKQSLAQHIDGQRHRASQDAMLIQQTFIATRLKTEESDVTQLLGQASGNEGQPNLDHLLSRFA